MPKPYVLLDQDARVALKKGVDVMAHLIRVTLGPRARTVAIQPIVGSSRPPEFLDDGATIARRTLQLARPFEDMGAMIIGQLARNMCHTTGDGPATAVVIAQSVKNRSATSRPGATRCSSNGAWRRRFRSRSPNWTSRRVRSRTRT